MLRHIHVETTMFGDGDDRRGAETDLCWWLEALTQRSQDYLKQHPNAPRLYKSGVVWEAPKQFGGDCEEVYILRRALGKAAKERDVKKVLEKIQDVFGGEHFCDYGVILELGRIDCDGIATARAAELRQAGIQAKPYMTSRTRPDGGTTYHALVLWPPFGPTPHWSSEDPSLLLGMHQPARKADRDAEIAKNQERYDYIRSRGRAALQSQNAPVSIEDILGVRRRAPVGNPEADLEAILSAVLR